MDAYAIRFAKCSCNVFRLVQKLSLDLGEFACAYLDDILVTSNSWEEHAVHLSSLYVRRGCFTGIELVLGLTTWVHFLPVPFNSTV